MAANQTGSSTHKESSIYSPALAAAIHNLQIPEKVFLKVADKFDDKYLNTAGKRWVIDYSGSHRYVYFKQDDLSNVLVKYICFKYISTRLPTYLPSLSADWNKAIDYCRQCGEVSFVILRAYLERDDIEPRAFYSILFGLKVLCIEELPGFQLDDYDKLPFIPRPFSQHRGIYQEIDNVLHPFEKNMIVNGLFEMARAIARGKCYTLNEIRDAAILGLVYTTGARPVQIAKLAAEDIRIDTRHTQSGLIRYSVLLPYAKQRRITVERLFLALPPEMGQILMHYIDRNARNAEDKLFDDVALSSEYVSHAINRCILRFSSSDFQQAVARGEAAQPIITPTDLRHNVGHSLAMQGVSAEEIAHILGHTSLVIAKYYILATPALALVRAKALGVNPVWQNMVAMMLTGELSSSVEWQGRRVAGVVGDELHTEIGGCSRADHECPFSEVRCCYGCLYYRPFIDGNHQSVFNSVTKEMDELVELSDSVGYARNPLISLHETTHLEIQSVITRCRFHHEKGYSA